MNQNVQPELSIDKYDIPQVLAASLDIEELERRLELSEVAMEVAYSEADYAEYEAAMAAGGGDWEVSGGCTVNPQTGQCEVKAKRSW